MKEKAKIMNWVYVGEADLTFGETTISNTAKYTLYGLLGLLITSAILAVAFQDTIYDYIVNPGIVISAEEVDIPVGTKFDPKQYVIAENERVEVLYPNTDDIDTKKLGSYIVEYIAKNTVSETTYTMRVNIVDNKPPTLRLKTDLVVLTRGVNTANFDPLEYIESYKDNYDKKDKLKLEYTKGLNFDNDTLEVLYSVEDLSKNKTTAKLKIVVNNSAEETRKMAEEIAKKNPVIVEKEVVVTETVPIVTPTQPNTNTETTNTNTTTTTEPPTTPVQPLQPYIDGVHDVTVQVGTDYGTLSNLLINGVSGSAYINVDFTSVNLRLPGQYTAVFSSADGVVKTATVNVTE